MTSPNQGLPSLASWGVKRRDPGNEVGINLGVFSVWVINKIFGHLILSPVI